MNDRPRVVVTRRLPAPVEERLAALFDVELNPEDRPFTPDELRAAIREADGLLVTVTDRLDAGVLATTPRRATIIANFGVGYDHIDVTAARRAGFVVTNTPGVLTDDTADLTMALILAAARRVGEGERHVRAGGWTGWRPTHMLGTRVTGATLGIVGMGRIGRAVAHRAHHGFGMRIAYLNRSAIRQADADAVNARACSSLDELLTVSDFVSLHVPATADTHHLIDADRLARMRPGAILVNTSRGSVVDTAALVAALDSGHLAGAGLDVYENEPQVDSRLVGLEHVVLLPHLGSSTVAARLAMGNRAVDNLAAALGGGAPADAVR